MSYSCHQVWKVCLHVFARLPYTQVRCGRTPGAAAARCARYARYARSYVVEQVERAQGGRGHAAEQVTLPKAVLLTASQDSRRKRPLRAPRCSLARSRVTWVGWT